MNIEIKIKLDEEDIEDLIAEIEDEDDCETSNDMLDANEDELNWYKAFLNKHSELFKNTRNPNAILARVDLIRRIHLGEQIVAKLKEEL